VISGLGRSTTLDYSSTSSAGPPIARGRRCHWAPHPICIERRQMGLTNPRARCQPWLPKPHALTSEQVWNGPFKENGSVFFVEETQARQVLRYRDGLPDKTHRTLGQEALVDNQRKLREIAGTPRKNLLTRSGGSSQSQILPLEKVQ